jgi:hypothetical protein
MEVKCVGVTFSDAARNVHARTSGSIVYGPPPVAEPVTCTTTAAHATLRPTSALCPVHTKRHPSMHLRVPTGNMHRTPAQVESAPHEKLRT